MPNLPVSYTTAKPANILQQEIPSASDHFIMALMKPGLSCSQVNQKTLSDSPKRSCRFHPDIIIRTGNLSATVTLPHRIPSVTMIWKPYTDRFMTNSLPVLKSGLSQMPRSDFFFPAGSIRHLYAPSQQGKALRQSRPSLSA